MNIQKYSLCYLIELLKKRKTKLHLKSLELRGSYSNFYKTILAAIT